MKNPYLLYDEDINSCDIQRNLRDSERVIEDSINEAIRKMIPVQNILKEYLGNSLFFKALEMTTEEINFYLKNKNILSNDLLKKISIVFNKMDLGKYSSKQYKITSLLKHRDISIKLINDIEKYKLNKNKYI